MLFKKKKRERHFPTIKRNAQLTVRLVVITLGGFDGEYDKISQLYLRLLTRLIDKSYEEYEITTELIDEEIENNDKFIYRFQIINHLENLVNSLSRVSKIINRLQKDKDANSNIQTKRYPIKLTRVIEKVLNKNIDNKNLKKVRDRIEHMDEDIYNMKLKGNMFVDINENYKNIEINEKSISIKDIAKLISEYDILMRAIFDSLPNRIENGKYYHDSK